MYLLEHLFLLTAVLRYNAAQDLGCAVPERIEGFSLDGEWDDESYPSGKTATYSCYPGYTRTGIIKRVCSEGHWTFIDPKGKCRKRSCGHPGDIPFGTFELKNERAFVFGAIVEFTCDEGYQMVSKHKIIECTATGWSNYPPHCEARICSPLVVTDKVKIISMSNEEDNFVGQVIRFQCKNPEFMLDGPFEIFCNSEGEWNLNPPTCIGIACSLPLISNGQVKNPKLTDYKVDERIQFTCDPGFKPSRNGEATCSKDGWNPTPSCEEITCDPYQYVAHGHLVEEKAVYREGDTITLNCDEYYKIQYEPNKPRVCTANGWYPPSSCISITCAKPKIKNGETYYTHTFPASHGSSVIYYCKDNFLPQSKEYWGRTNCTVTGWKPEPKCLRKCEPQDVEFDNGHIQPTQHVYVEGETIQFNCSTDFQTPHGTDHGEITCLSNGHFSPANCSRACSITQLQHGKFEQNKTVIDDYFRYECNDGFKSPNGNIVDSSLCLINGWSVTPACVEIRCTWHGEEYTSGQRIKFSCPSGKRPSGSGLTQCFYYGFGPLPDCEDENPNATTVSPDEPDSRLQCAPAHSPQNATIINPKAIYYCNDTVAMKCDEGYELHGSVSIQCKNGVWESPPQCIALKKCEDPPSIKNGRPHRDYTRQVYTSASVVKYSCNPGFHINGSDQITCDDGQWTTLPICTEDSCGKAPFVPHAFIKEQKKDFNHGESANYECINGFTFYGDSSAKCKEGQWQNIPTCAETGESCGAPPAVAFGDITDKRKDVYESGSYVEYMCPNYYVLEGNQRITCINGTWEKAPVCQKPCTIKERSMKENNIQLRLENKPKIYSKHGDTIEFACMDGYESPRDTNMSRICDQGVVQFPKCFKSGFCVLQQTIMNNHNIHYNRSTIVEQGETILFECNEGTMPEKDLQAKCEWKEVNYPKCVTEAESSV
ncbi:complement factor H-related protein 4-like [Pseudophryne corroboree]|uniref:complement factor H-related protein 4-like n=1 Tax=Pseudophryne corroboree TaxID=495146 RepID=UPI003081C827